MDTHISVLPWMRSYCCLEEVYQLLFEMAQKCIIWKLKAAKQLLTIVLVFGICHCVFIVGYHGNIIHIVNYIIYYKISLLNFFYTWAMNTIVYALKWKEFQEVLEVDTVSVLTTIKV
jgi:hypothetical protein